MKLKGFKIDGKIYFVSDVKIAEHGSLEKAAKALKSSQEKPISKKKEEKPESFPEIEKEIGIEP